MKKIIIISLLFVGISLTHILNAQNEEIINVAKGLGDYFQAKISNAILIDESVEIEIDESGYPLEISYIILNVGYTSFTSIASNLKGLVEYIKPTIHNRWKKDEYGDYVYSFTYVGIYHRICFNESKGENTITVICIRQLE